jgi:hypothetical protein
MDLNAFALQLIQAYNAEHNRLRRARAEFNRIYRDNEWQAGMRAMNYTVHPDLRMDSRTWDYRRVRGHFHDRGLTHVQLKTAFVSHVAKRREIRILERELANMRLICDESSRTVKEYVAKLECAKDTPVLSKLGKKWQQLVDARFEEKRAYDARWRARCAIAAFNKMNLGIQIKFGTCRRGGGSMSYISHVVVNGDKIKLARFLDNAIFETAILSG